MPTVPLGSACRDWPALPTMPIPAVHQREWDLDNKIRRALAAIPNVIVTSTVVLDRETNTRESVEKTDPTKTPIKQSDYSRPVYPNAAPPACALGLQQQGGGPNQPVNLAAVGSKSGEPGEETKTESVNGVSVMSTEKVSDGRATKSAKVAVGIPASYYEKVWLERNPPKSGEEPKKPDQTALDAIRVEITKDIVSQVGTLVQPLLPNVTDPTTLVTATTFQDIKPTEIPGPAVPQRVLTWLAGNWTMLWMMGLVLASVAMLRSARRRPPAAAAGQSLGAAGTVAARISASEATAEEKEEPVEVAAARRLRRISGSGPSLRDELSELVKEDPDSAASILRSWIGQAN